MLNLGFGSVTGWVTSGVRVKTGCFHFGCRFGYGFGLFGSGFGSQVCFARSNHPHCLLLKAPRERQRERAKEQEGSEKVRQRVTKEKQSTTTATNWGAEENQNRTAAVAHKGVQTGSKIAQLAP